MRLLAGALIALGFCLPGQSEAAACREESYAGKSYTICEVDAGGEELRLFLRDAAGEVFGHFGRVDSALKGEGRRLGFAMNAGMYHDDRAPVGFYLEDGLELQGLMTRAGPGNFGLLPNGVFCVRPGRADVF
ncbi:MAG: hypothetical protein P1U53_14270, partial [Sulfitobacter sp.]|nr:hypothetical protein [Sulfitobacter sp.]